MLNDIRALCCVDERHLVHFIGAYHAPENGQARAQSPCDCMPWHAHTPDQAYCATVPCSWTALRASIPIWHIAQPCAPAAGRHGCVAPMRQRLQA